jgi:hypothetical protein
MEQAMSWSIRCYDPLDGTTIGTVRYDDEATARLAFETVCEDARKNGGGYELRHGGKWLTAFAVQLPTGKGAPPKS